MRIAMVSEHASPLAALGGVDAGGQNVHVAALALGLGARGHQVRVYTRRDSIDLPERVELGPGAEVVHVPAGPAEPIAKDEMLPFMPAFGRRMARTWIRDGIPHLVHSHFWMSGIAALEAVRAVDVPVVHTFHALGTVKRRHQGMRDSSPAQRLRTEARIGRSVDRVIATCTDEIEELDRMGVPIDGISVVPCGVDTTLFTPFSSSSPITSSARSTSSSPSTWPSPRISAAPGGTAAGRLPHPSLVESHWSGRTLLSVGRLVERKGVDTVIEALAELPDTQLVIAGGPDRNALATDPEATRLRRRAAELGVSDRVRLLGSVPHEALPGLMRVSDVVVCTPWYEPFGIVPIEAAACGTPVVGAAVGGLLDTIVDGHTGTLVPPKDPHATAAAIRQLLDDPARRLAYGRAARQRAVSLYDWESVTAATDRVYAGVVAADSRSEVSA